MASQVTRTLSIMLLMLCSSILSLQHLIVETVVVIQRFLFLHWRQSLIVCVWNQTIFVNCFDQKGCRSNPSCLCFLGDPRNLSPLLPPLSPVMAPLQTQYSVHSSTVFLASIRSVRDFLTLQKPDKSSTFLIAYKHLTSNAYKETMACGNFK